jgi:hypothetical protein
LLDMIAAELAGSQGTGHGGVPRSLPLVWLDAMDLLTDVDAALSAWQRGIPPMRIPPATPAATAADRLRELTERAWQPMDVARIRNLTAALTGWAQRANQLLYPPRHTFLDAPCPVCGATTAKRRDAAGELVNVPALQIDVQAGAECQHCGATWAPALFTHLSRLLELELPAGVVGYINERPRGQTSP